jgi:hypothetical protein
MPEINSLKQRVRRRWSSITKVAVIVVPLLLSSALAGPAMATSDVNAGARAAGSTAASPIKSVQSAKVPAGMTAVPAYSSSLMLKPTIVKPGIVVYHVTQAGYIAHDCQSLGVDPEGYEAVDCADVYAEPSDNGGAVFVIPAAEQICQIAINGSKQLRQCNEASAYFGLYSQGPTRRAYGAIDSSCNGDCSTGRNIWIDYGEYYDISTCNYDVNGPNAVWTTIFSDNLTYIGTNDGLFQPSANFASAHVLICP